ALVIEQREINSPGVHTYSGWRRIVQRRVFRQPSLDFGPKPQNIPAKVSIRVDVSVGEPMWFLKLELLAVPAACNKPSAGGPQVNRHEIGGGLHSSRDSMSST